MESKRKGIEMTKRSLTDAERLEVTVGILTDRQLDEYRQRCEKLEESPPLWEAGICPACGGEYYGDEMQGAESDEDSETRSYVCPNCGSTVEEYFELVNITAKP